MAGERTSASIPVSTNDRLLNLAEAAARLRMGQSTLRQALYERRGPVAIKLPGSDRWRFRPSDLDDYVHAGEISPKRGLVSEAEGRDGEAA
jgi:predicted DNA-binding transcriptional regulator AlpA